jgi:hypothetical protein
VGVGRGGAAGRSCTGQRRRAPDGARRLRRRR